MEKSPNAFRTISEAATELDVPQHVLRFWETKFKQIKPMKRGGGRRFYRPQDVALIKGIKYFLYAQGYTIKGVQKILAKKGVVYATNIWRDVEDQSLPLVENIAGIEMPENLIGNNISDIVDNLSPADFVSEANPIRYSSVISTVEVDGYNDGESRFKAEKDVKIKHILSELNEIKELIKSTKV